jgi:hypothetical protein
LAVKKSVLAEEGRTDTDIYHCLQRGDQFFGLRRTYEPLDAEDADRLPAEPTIIRRRDWWRVAWDQGRGAWRLVLVSAPWLDEWLRSRDRADTSSV